MVRVRRLDVASAWTGRSDTDGSGGVKRGRQGDASGLASFASDDVIHPLCSRRIRPCPTGATVRGAGLTAPLPNPHQPSAGNKRGDVFQHRICRSTHPPLGYAARVLVNALTALSLSTLPCFSNLVTTPVHGSECRSPLSSPATQAGLRAAPFINTRLRRAASS